MAAAHAGSLGAGDGHDGAPLGPVLVLADVLPEEAALLGPLHGRLRGREVAALHQRREELGQQRRLQLHSRPLLQRAERLAVVVLAEVLQTQADRLLLTVL